MPSNQILDLKSGDVIKVFREIEKTPEMTQRDLSSRLGFSLGKVNFLIKALIAKSLIKADNFKKANNKYSYAYILTPQGIEEKARLTYHFLRQKVREYEQLEKDIELLKKEVTVFDTNTHVTSQLKHQANKEV